MNIQKLLRLGLLLASVFILSAHAAEGEISADREIELSILDEQIEGVPRYREEVQIEGLRAINHPVARLDPAQYNRALELIILLNQILQNRQAIEEDQQAQQLPIDQIINERCCSLRARKIAYSCFCCFSIATASATVMYLNIKQ